jgi:hypothetical protein
MAKPSKVTGQEPLSVEIPDSIQSLAHEDEPVPPALDERVLVRFTGPWKNYSRGDITRLHDAEARSVVAKGLAVQQDE